MGHDCLRTNDVDMLSLTPSASIPTVRTLISGAYFTEVFSPRISYQ